MRKGILVMLIGSILLVYSCSDKAGAPAHLIARDKMEDVLWDMMRADLFINNYMVIKDTALDKKKQGIHLYTRILKMHKISQEDFRESFKYYRSQPIELKDLMDSLSRRKDSLPVSKPTKMPMQADTVIKGKLSGKKEE